LTIETEIRPIDTRGCVTAKGMTAGEFAKLIEAALAEADRGGLSAEEQILVLELIVRSERENLVTAPELPHRRMG
jgi:hypothetical protein